MANEACPKAGDSPFSSDKHAQLILAQVNKMRNGEHFCDVQLQVGKETFKVHRLVLAASSPYFAALFTGGMKESSKDVVQILGIEAGIFQILLDFIYTGIVNIGVNNVQELIVAADMLQLTEVVNLCCEFLKGQIDPLNCIGIFQFSEQIACHDLLEFTENYIHVHFLEVHSGEEFLALTKDQLIKILRSEELSIEDEYQVFLAAMQWILKDLGKRRKHVVEVLEPIRFPLLPPQRLLKYIEGVSDFNLRVALQTLLKEYCEVCKSPKENKFCSFLQTSKVRPRKKARKYLYAVGGYTRLQGGRWSDSRALSCVERFDTFSQYWTTVSSLHQARCGLGVAVLGGMVYAIGGGWVGAEIGNTIERYDPDENKWEVVGNMALSRYYFGCCEMQGLIYVIGGISNEGIELRSFEVYDPLSKRWSPLPPMGTRRAYLGVAALNDCIYSVGGWNETQDALHTVEKYSFEEEKWVEVASMKVPRAGMCVVAVNGLLYVSGGRSSSHDFLAPGTLDSVEVYNPHSDTWTEIGNMITSRCEGGVAVL
ncbi:actin-binding protein IPP isoform 3-T3 [Lycaon pictus]|uniref:Intracisternal A particle-promoted polypeptide n=1 Tax=Canis lupus familiaris TaxID=9615 RepID=A0A8C0SWM5_CANLF|nr:actin-binding protein IPP isoform X3 [Canis lupus dingo]XP_038307968.1 actin-binding protein IPP isoform X3 [Canis lupus familiaris]XP_038414134.1 actin-binding protein IPP isoform X3 [Canis lupus familiaris]XP_038543751.1 actin-binding protein IPP isoform X3 [Canis lupus familiaris]XP_048950402.1 actin-binding protein IPP isoform X3 [Canis lupus dingo]